MTAARRATVFLTIEVPIDLPDGASLDVLQAHYIGAAQGRVFAAAVDLLRPPRVVHDTPHIEVRVIRR